MCKCDFTDTRFQVETCPNTHSPATTNNRVIGWNLEGPLKANRSLRTSYVTLTRVHTEWCYSKSTATLPTLRTIRCHSFPLFSIFFHFFFVSPKSINPLFAICTPQPSISISLSKKKPFTHIFFQ